ncbi:MAG: TldD/PmbA family protein, partial [Candidatus Omnitrophica bacterium]|nr:TldD/PmbA family protein [Candidatus Omnitrophota bacterium]
MEKILSRLQEKMAALDCEHSDLRWVQLKRQKIRTRHGAVDEAGEIRSEGVGIRVLKEGAFGFSATGDLSEKSLFDHLNQAYQMARRFSKIRHAEVKLAPAKPVRAKWKAKIKEDPWKISLAQKVMPLIEAEKRMLSRSGVDSTSGALDFTEKKVVFISGSGSWIEQVYYRSGGWLLGEVDISSKHTFGNGFEKIKRSWPGPSGRFRAQGYEAIRDLEFEKETDRLGEELKELRRSPEAPAGKFDLILKGSILALQLHETFGHASESDRVYGYEDNFGGRTFLNPGLLGGLPVASPCVNLVSDARPQARQAGAGSFVYDDEGVLAKRFEILKKGVFKNYLTSRETAFFLNQNESTVDMVAEDWSHYPLIRMTNFNFLPGKGSLNDLIHDTEEGILLDNELSWSIDEMR